MQAAGQTFPDTLVPVDLRPLIEALKRKLAGRLVGVVLYGSHARGTARPESDIDLLVIASELPGGRLARSDLFVDLQFEAGYPYPPASLLGKTTAEFERTFPSLFLDIGLDGVVLFDPTGYVADKLARIRDLIREAGLVRRPLNGEFTWQFTHPVPLPPGGWQLDWGGYCEFRE